MSTLPAGASPLYVAAIVIALAVIAAVAALWRRRAQPWNRWNVELYDAVKKGDIDKAMRALEQGADPNVKGPDGYTPLHIAAHENYSELAKVLIKYGAKVDLKDRYGNTPLHVAAYRGHLNVASLLLKHGADPCITNKDGDIHLVTARKRRAEEVYILLEGVSSKCRNATR